MSILVGKDTRLLVQGITGREGAFHTEQMKAYGTNVVAGVTPGKGGEWVHGVPVFDTVKEAINATGANTLYHLHEKDKLRWNSGGYDRDKVSALYAAMDESHYLPHTIASAIEISRPVNLPKALRALDIMNGLVREVSDEVILEHKALVGRYGFGCEPASAASVAGLHLLLDEQVISPDENVVCILTGHVLKDPDAPVKYHMGVDMKNATPPPAEPPTGKCSNAPKRVPDDLDAICAALGEKPPQ